MALFRLLSLAAVATFALVQAEPALVHAEPALVARDPVLFTFTGGNYLGWQTWDWDAMTHLGFWTPPSAEVRAMAKSHNVKLFKDVSVEVKDWTSAASRAKIVNATVDMVKKYSLDGAFFDYEGNGLSKQAKADYTTLTEETTAALKALNAKVMVCVGGRPTYELRNYDYAGLAAASDFLFVMGYDLHLWDDYTCITTSKGNVCSPAEASIRELEAGIAEYLKLVDPAKLVLGLPWYGQRYTQVAVPINEGQIDYRDVLSAFDAGIVTKRVHDKDSNSWKIDCRTSCLPGRPGRTVWYDDATTLTPKFQLAGSHGLRGVGMWKVDDLPVPANGSDPHAAERIAMWAAVSGWRNGSLAGTHHTPTPTLGSVPFMASGGTTTSQTTSPTIPAGSADFLRATLLQTSEFIVNPSRSKPDRLTPYTITFNASATDLPSAPTINVTLGDLRQPIVGFGGAVTDAVAHVFSSMSAKLQDEAVEALWGATGQKYNMGRLTIGATDFSTTVYNYNDHAGDLAQANFSIDHDRDKIIPLVKRALASASKAGTPLEFVSSPWSPPGWMKHGWLTRKGYMRNSAKPGMLYDTKIFDSYALYTSKYLSAYAAAGVNISRVTIQNEPDSADHMVVGTYPACNFNGTGEGLYLKDHLGPRLRLDHPSVQIYVHDGQKYHDVPIATRVDAIVAAAGGMKYIDGVAFHWYGNNLENYQYLGALHKARPSLKLLATEATLKDPRTQLTDPWGEAQKYAVDIIGDLNNGAEGWIEWNVLLDSSGGPTCIGPTATTICVPDIGHCDAPLLYDTHKDTLEYRDTYHIMAHFSRYLPRGARIVGTSVAQPNPSDALGISKAPLLVAALTPDSKSLVVVALNPSKTDEAPYKLDLGRDLGIATVSMPPRSLHTLLVPLK